MVMEWMGVRKMIVGTNKKGGIMETSGVSIGITTVGITFATISHPNSIKAINSTVSNAGDVCHSKLVPFAVPISLILSAMMSMFFLPKLSLD